MLAPSRFENLLLDICEKLFKKEISQSFIKQPTKQLLMMKIFDSQSQIDRFNSYQDSIFESQTQLLDPHISVMHLREQFDPSKLAYIINNLELFENDLDSQGNPQKLKKLKSTLERYLHTSRHGCVNTIYLKHNNRGRFFAARSASLQGMKKAIRHTIASDFYRDVDIKNSHPVMLKFLCDQENLDCPFLSQYVSNREELLGQIGVNREIAKDTYLSLTNGGKKAIEIQNTEHIKGYMAEMKRLHKHFAEKEHELLKQVKEERVKKGKDYNHEAALTNVLLCDLENDVLMAIFSFFGKPKDAVLCFDGIMLPKSRFQNLDLQGCATFVKLTVGIDIEVCEKQLNQILEVPKDAPVYEYPSLNFFEDYVKLVHEKSVSLDWAIEWSFNSIAHIENGGSQYFLTKSEKFVDHDYDSGNLTMSYEWNRQKINDVETTLQVDCSIFNPFYSSKFVKTLSVENEKARKTATSSLPSNLETMQSQLFLYDTIGKSAKNKKGFLTHIMQKCKIQSFSNVIFFPYLEKKGYPLSDKRFFNLFTGFPLEQKVSNEPLPKFEDSKFYNHLKSEFFNNNLDELNHFLDHVADIIQDPLHIKGPGHVFFSKPGMGKGLLAKFMHKLIGDQNVAIISNLDAYFDNQFNADNTCKLLKIFEEVSEKGSAFKNHNRLKAELTAPKERVEKKYFDPISTTNCSRYWFFSNNKNTLYVEAQDRRYTLHELNNRYADNFEYFKPLWQELENINFLLSAFQFFTTRAYQLKNVLQSFDTAYKKDQKFANLSGGIKFIVDHVEENFRKAENKNFLIKSTDLRDEFKLWCEHKGTAFNLETLYTHLTMVGIEKPKQRRIDGKSSKCFELNLAVLEAKIQSHIKDSTWKFDFGPNSNEDSPLETAKTVNMLFET